jgi:hypothetical protein
MKYSTETIRFLNHIERERQHICDVFNAKLSIAISANDRAQAELRETDRRLTDSVSRGNNTATALFAVQAKNKSILDAARSILSKMRVNIYVAGKCTPRWFKTGKWWSRETGGLTDDFIAEMTDDEVLEAIEFYGKPDSPLMLPSSNRDNPIKKCLDDEKN